jgi:hypothetical protein
LIGVEESKKTFPGKRIISKHEDHGSPNVGSHEPAIKITTAEKLRNMMMMIIITITITMKIAERKHNQHRKEKLMQFNAFALLGRKH